MADKKEIPLRSFATIKQWEAWLSRHFENPEGLWIRFYKKASDVKSINHDEALDLALCYGWIDGQAKPFDEISWLQKFTPRRAKSIWSKRNIEHIERLRGEGKMRPSGEAAVAAAKADGRWDIAYDSSKNMAVPEDFLKALGKNKKAKTFFETLNKANVYAISWRLQTAKKPETREKRLAKILEMMARGEKFH